MSYPDPSTSGCPYKKHLIALRRAFLSGRVFGTAKWGELSSYRPRDAIAVCAGDARESAMVAQLVPAAEIH